MQAEVGSYQELYRIGRTPLPTDSSDKVRRGRAIGTLQPFIQKVDGDVRGKSSFKD